MRKLLIILGLSSIVLLTGCDSNEENVKLQIEGQYINTTETITLRTYNGYKLVESRIKDNEDDSADTVLKIDKPIKQNTRK